MSKITINGEPTEVPAAPLMSNDQLHLALIQAALAGDLYACAVCEIAMDGFPRARTWHALDASRRQHLHREYLLSAGPDRWNRERAHFELTRQAYAAGAA